MRNLSSKVQLYLSVFMLLFSIAIPIYGQNTFFNPVTPQTLSEFIQLNNQIANTFGPALYQWVGTCNGDSDDGDADRILKVNYDGDWKNLNNWESLENIHEPSPSYDIRPYGYYNVTWTDNYWIIVYSFFYARDWARNGCGEDEHEGDMAKAFLVVKRPQSTSDKPEDLIIGYTVSGGDENCINIQEGNENITVVNAIKDVNETVHPIISSAAGSHHYYSNYLEGLLDRKTPAVCRPYATGLLKYTPALSPSSALSNLLPAPECVWNDPNGGDLGICQTRFSATNVVTCSENEESYGLIDIFDENQGLWAQRTNGDLFTQDNSLGDQRLVCEGGGCTGIPYTDKDPFAPWATNTGDEGLNPLEFIHRKFDTFNCDCNNNPNCEPVEITDCNYIYNPYMCEFYDIETSENFEYNGEWISNPHQDGNDLIAVFTFSAFNGFTGTPTDVTWGWDVPPGTVVDCDGCNPAPNEPPANRITLTFRNTTLEDILSNPEKYRISASADFLECGKITIFRPLSTELNGLIAPGGDCEKLIFEIKDEYHIDGNVYDWNFPLYGALAVVQNNGRKVEFDTKSVIDQTTDATNPDKMLDWNLKVSNLSSTTRTFEFNGGIKIPECDFDFTRLSLALYPNPSTHEIFVDFKGLEQKEGLEVVIVDHLLRPLKKQFFYPGEQSVDVSGFENGIYYIYAVTEKGKVLCEKFCVSGH